MFGMIKMMMDKFSNEENGDFPDDNSFRNKKYLNHQIFQNKKGFYLFTSNNKVDFEKFTDEKYNLSQLSNLLRDSLKNKDLIQYGKTYCAKLGANQHRCIMIDKKLFEILVQSEFSKVNAYKALRKWMEKEEKAFKSFEKKKAGDNLQT